MTERPILAIYLEPAPYILGLIEELRRQWPQSIDVLYASNSITQNWGTDVGEHGAELLPASWIAAIAEIWRRLASRRYGAVHLAGWGHPRLLAALVIATWFGTPVAIESDTQANPVYSLLDRSKAWVKRIVYPWLFSLPAVFLPGGTRQAAYLRSYGVPAARIRIAQMTVDVERISSYCAHLTTEKRLEALRRIGIESNQVRFLYVGRLEPYKGVLDLLETFQTFAKERVDVCLMVAGDGSLREAVTSASSRNGAIHYLGRLAAEHVWEAYCLADVFVLVSHLDAWGLVVNEAMAASLPIIATTRVGCVDDLVKPWGNGLVIAAGSPDALLDAMRKLADSATDRARMGEESLRLIKDWTLENQSARTADAWKSVGA